MWLLLFAEAQISRGWWFDIVDKWGNTATILGLIFTLIAFPVTWNLQTKIKRASQETLRKVALVVLSTTVEDICRQLVGAREAGRLAQWLRVFDSCQHIRIGVLRLVGNPHLTPEETLALRQSADDLTQVIRYIEVNKLIPNPPSVFQNDKKGKIDGMILLLSKIQARLGNKTWEA
jgi:hypothetical protein